MPAAASPTVRGVAPQLGWATEWLPDGRLLVPGQELLRRRLALTGSVCQTRRRCRRGEGGWAMAADQGDRTGQIDHIEVRVVLDATGAEGDALAESVGQLQEELLELDVDDVRPPAAGDAPAGTKGVELLALGALVVKLVRSRQVLGQVVAAVRDWLTRNDAESVRIEIDGDVLEIKGVSPPEKKLLIDNWLERHSGA
jgi:hypothetical protein